MFSGGFGLAESNLDKLLNNELVLAFKKISKKDELTKKKGLTELKALIPAIIAKSEEETAFVNRFIIAWPSINTHKDAKVRSLGFEVLSILAAQLGKRISPFLKNFIPHWIISFFDVSLEVQRVSKQVFNETFPVEAKHASIICHYHSEIINLITNNSKINTTFLKQQGQTPPEEFEDRYLRAVTTSIYALSYLIDNFPENNKIDTVVDNYRKLMDLKFWNLFSAPESLIKKSLFILLNTVSSKFPELISREETLKTIWSLILEFPSKNEIYIPAMWNGLISFIKAFPKVLDFPANNANKNPSNLDQMKGKGENKEDENKDEKNEKEKGKNQGDVQVQQNQQGESKLFKSLFAMLKQGCYDIDESYYNLLSFLSLLPESVLTIKFFDNFFISFWKGLFGMELIKKKQIACVSYFECLLYSTIKQRKIEGDNHALILFKNHFLPLVQGFLTYEDNVVEEIATSFSEFLNKILTKENCEEFTQNFWQFLENYHNNNKNNKNYNHEIYCKKTIQLLQAISNTQNTKLINMGINFYQQILDSITNDSVEQKSLESLGTLQLIFTTINSFGTLLFPPETDIEIFLNKLLNSCESAKKNKITNCFSILFKICGKYIHIISQFTKDIIAKILTIVSDDNLMLDSFLVELINHGITNLDSPLLFEISTIIINNVIALKEVPDYEVSIATITLTYYPGLSDTEKLEIVKKLNTSLKLNLTEDKFNCDAYQRLLQILSHLMKGSFMENKNQDWLTIECEIANTLLSAMFSKNISEKCIELCTQSLTSILKSIKDEEIISKKIFDPTNTQIMNNIVNHSLEISDGSKHVYELCNKLESINQNNNYSKNIMHNIFSTIKSEQEKNALVLFQALDIDFLSTGIIFQTQIFQKLNTNNDENKEVILKLIDLMHFFAVFCKNYYSNNLKEDLAIEIITTFILFDFIFNQNLKPIYQDLRNSWHETSQSLHFVLECLINPIFDDSSLTKQVAEYGISLVKENEQNPLSLLTAYAIFHKISENNNTIFAREFLPALSKNLKEYRKEVLSSFLPKLLNSVQENDKELLLFFTKNVYDFFHLISSKMNVQVEDFAQIFYSVKSLLEISVFTDSQCNYMVALIGNFMSLKHFEKLNNYNQYIIFSIISILLDNAQTQFPEADHLFWKNLFDIIAKNIATLNYNDPTNWQEYHSSLSLFSSILKRSKNKNFFDIEKPRLWTEKPDILLVTIFKNFLFGSEKTMISLSPILNELAGLSPFFNEKHYSLISPLLLDNMLYKALQESKILPIKYASYTILAQIISEKNLSKPKDSVHKANEGEVYHDSNPLSKVLKQILESNVTKKQEEESSLYFSWLILLEHLSTPSQKEKSDIISYVKNSNIAKVVLDDIFQMINLDVIPPEQIDETTTLSELAAYVYKRLVYKLPSIVRCWFNDLVNRSKSKDVQAYTTKYITSDLIRDEIRYIQIFNKDPTARIPTPKEVQYISNLTPDNANFSVKAFSGTQNEVHATFEKDDVQTCIILTFSKHHPLAPVTVTSKHRMGVSESLWRKWMLSMTSLLLNQDGTVLDATILWQSSLNKHFEGLELCPICYALFHASNYSVPSMPCKQCKTKFHSSCLYEWFNSSHKNECPMCRAAIG